MPRTNDFEIYLDPRDVSDIVSDVSQIEGIDIRLPTKPLLEPDDSKVHPVYCISFDQLAPVIISLSGATTALLLLATAIFQFKTAKANAEQPDKQSAPQGPVIHVQNNLVQLTEFANPEALAAYLEEHLRDDE